MSALDVERFTFSDHAVERFMERTNSTGAKMAVRNMRSTMKLAQKAQRKNFVEMFFKYEQVPAEYYITNRWVFVVVNNEVTTCYKKDRKEIKTLYKIVEDYDG